LQPVDRDPQIDQVCIAAPEVVHLADALEYQLVLRIDTGVVDREVVAAFDELAQGVPCQGRGPEYLMSEGHGFLS
jgi:hypothetical protein